MEALARDLSQPFDRLDFTPLPFLQFSPLTLLATYRDWDLTDGKPKRTKRNETYPSPGNWTKVNETNVCGAPR